MQMQFIKSSQNPSFHLSPNLRKKDCLGCKDCTGMCLEFAEMQMDTTKKSVVSDFLHGFFHILQRPENS